jgi:uncharacterized membrane protein YhiD involved in acid resistance
MPLDQLIASPPASLATFAADMLLGLALSLVVAWYYQAYGQAITNRRKLAALMPILTVTTGIVITIVKSSLALSLGLVGALSIVRFRTAIKEPEELMFLFISIAIGLGVGAEQRWITAAGVAVLMAYMSVRLAFGRKSQPHNLYLNLLVEDDGSASLNEVNACLLNHVDVVDFRRLDSRDGTLQLTYYIYCPDAQTVNDLVADLKTSFAAAEISLLQQEHVLGD